MSGSAKQYVDLAGITVYDEEIKNYIAQLGPSVTYTLSQDPNDPRKIILTPSSGTGSEVTIPEDAIYLTKSEYDNITPETDQLYGITDWSPEAEELIDDTTTSISKTWSSSKTNTELGNKANTSSLSTVATSGSYADLSNKPTIPTALSQLTDDTTHRVVTDTEKSTWDSKASSSDLSALSTTVTNNNTAQNNKHIVTSKSVATTGWTSDITSQSGTTLYKKTIALSHVYVTSPIVDIGASGVLPTVAEQEAYDLLQYVTINGTTLTLYGSAIPTTAYYINITGVD